MNFSFSIHKNGFAPQNSPAHYAPNVGAAVSDEVVNGGKDVLLSAT